MLQKLASFSDILQNVINLNLITSNILMSSNFAKYFLSDILLLLRNSFLNFIVFFLEILRTDLFFSFSNSLICALHS